MPSSSLSHLFTSSNRQIGEIGFELELSSVRRNDVPSSSQYYLDHDASIESNKPTLDGIIIDSPLSAYNYRSEVVGIEVVSGILNTENPDYPGIVKQICKHARQLREPNQSFREGFHVHVNCPYNLRVLKNAIVLGLHLEQVFFALAGMGYKFRGVENNSVYCRPISKDGPPVGKIVSSRNFGKVFVINDLLDSETVADFRERYGNLNVLTSKYTPVRYCWLNLFNMLVRGGKGTLEFRLFNKSLDPCFLMAIIDFCKAFVETLYNNPSFYRQNGLDQVNSVFDIRDKNSIVDTFLHFISLTELKSNVVDKLLQIIHLSPMEGMKLKDELTYTHLMFHGSRGDISPVHWESGNYHTSYLDHDSIIKPEFEDIYSIPKPKGEKAIFEIEITPTIKSKFTPVMNPVINKPIKDIDYTRVDTRDIDIRWNLDLNTGTITTNDTPVPNTRPRIRRER